MTDTAVTFVGRCHCGQANQPAVPTKAVEPESIRFSPSLFTLGITVIVEVFESIHTFMALPQFGFGVYTAMAISNLSTLRSAFENVFLRFPRNPASCKLGQSVAFVPANCSLAFEKSDPSMQKLQLTPPVCTHLSANHPCARNKAPQSCEWVYSPELTLLQWQCCRRHANGN